MLDYKASCLCKGGTIIYLLWWDGYDQCTACNQILEFDSDCQKWCSYCSIIYTGCRYCLTTNIIFGITDQSQCKKCKRISFITIDMTNIKDYFLEINTYNHNQIADYINSKIDNPLNIYSFIKNNFSNFFQN